MTRAPIVALFHKMREQVAGANPALSLKAEQQVEIGRTYAAHYVDAVRAGDGAPQLLMSAIAVLGKANQHQLLGFLAEIEDRLAEVGP